MGFIKWLASLYWDGILSVPMGWISSIFNYEVPPGWQSTALKIVFSLLLLGLIWEVYLRVRKIIRKRRLKDALLSGEILSKDDAYKTKDTAFAESLEAVQHLEHTIEPLKKQKQWGRLGEVYASLNRHKEAAKYFRKNKDYRRAAMELAKAGYTVRAARQLQKAGDFVTAAQFFADKGKYLQAGRALEKEGDFAQAASLYVQAKRYPQALQMFLEYFESAEGSPEQQLKAAEHCHAALQDEAFLAKASEEDARSLVLAVAERFAAAGRDDIAAKLFRDSGEYGRAGEMYLRLGRLEEASACMKQAGRQKEATEIGARYYESRKLWKEAGMAYESIGDFRRAAAAFSKAPDPARSASNYEKAQEYYGAGFALVHLKEWEKAILMFQKVQEEHPNYSESRALLGRAFYELGDFEHCAATLENHLTGERVTKHNINYFWMLSLAYEQLGELAKSKEVLMKIRTVDVNYRDVSQRLSNIQTRISIGAGVDPRMANTVGGAPSQQATAVMSMVEQQIGPRYKLERELGRGGMGVVYVAHDTQLDRPVALKFLGSLVDGSEEYRQRFIREAQAAAKVQHPNIISIFDIGTQEGKVYIAMEFVDGPNLHRFVSKKGKLTAREAVNVLTQALTALEAVHDAGIVHRDLKPDNILIGKGGLVKLMDFGLAKQEGKRITATNIVMGTPCYMSPEQTRGDQVDVRSDIYAMGLILHELLTGKIVFGDGDVLQRQQTEVPPAPGQLVEGVPPVLDEIVMKAIAKKCEERFQTAREMRMALRQVSQQAEAAS